MQDVINAAQRWMNADPDPQTRAETMALLDAGDEASLREQFGQRLQFGTAGIRGTMGAGPGRINQALIRQVTAGLANYLLSTCPDATDRGVVVGYDGRRNSHLFADEAARILAGKGITVWFFPVVVPTPVLAHAVTHHGAAAGVMVTASHNPPQDNGYKVYWGNGAQIITPHDVGISDQIDAVGGPWNVAVPSRASVSAHIHTVPQTTWADYLQRVLSWRVLPHTGINAVYTAMHGVGWDSLQRVCAAAGHRPLIAVPEQRDPNEAFPTVSFPNPEEPGALDLAMALAQDAGAEIIIAHDPDADRLAVALPNDQGGWSRLTGNEVGLLLADTLLTHGPQAAPRMVATTVVSTSLLGRVANAHGAQLTETLTGFKWIANAAIDFDGTFLVGFEEALGYSVGDVVRDKDGVSAALHILDLASWCKAQGITLRDHLTSLYRRYGYAGSAQHSIRMPGASGAQRIQQILANLRTAPPTQFAGRQVWRIRDALHDTATQTKTGHSEPLGLPKSNVLTFDLEGGCRVIARPSGTEPKVKFYFEVIIDMNDGDSLADVSQRADAQIDALRADLLQQIGA